MVRQILFLIISFLLLSLDLSSQCAMCKAVVEANLKEGGSAGAGLNEGILYLMATPYIAVLLFGIFYYLQQRKKEPA